MHSITPFARTHWSPRVFALAAMTTWMLAFPLPAGAIDIVIHLNDKGMNPSYDPSGSRLETIANAAAIYWEEALPESGTYDVDLWWDNGLDGTTLGNWSWDSVGNDNIRINPGPSAGPWFIDPTPNDHSEFDFVTQDRFWNADDGRWEYRGGQWLDRDVDPAEQSAWFGGSPPGLMEIGYRGWATDPTLQGQFDLFSTVIHELGHEMGVNGSGGPWEADPAWLAGATATFNENAGGDHLAARTSLMCDGCGLLGTRRFPSAADIMAAADDESMTTIDLPRQDYLVGVSWNNGPSWLGGTVPDQWDDAFIRHGGGVWLSGNATAQTLLISAGSSLSTWAHKLEVPGHTDVVSVGSLASDISVMSGGEVMLNDLTLAGGILDMHGGLATLVGNTVITSNAGFTGEISGYGTVDAGVTLVNNGMIKSDSLMLTFHAAYPGTFDLDGTGTEHGRVDASHGSLTFDGPLADAFDGKMNIGIGKSITMGKDWTLGVGGLVDLNGGSAAAATVAGSTTTTTVDGSILVHRLGKLATQQAVFNPTASVLVTDSHDRLILDATTFFKGGIYDGDGAVEQQGDVQVWKDTTMYAAEYDWGNSTAGDAHNTYINETVTFRIDSDTTGTPRNEYRGTINVTGGTLAVQLDSGWLLPRRGAEPGDGAPGRLVFRPGDAHAPKLTGVPLTVEGSVLASGGLALVEADFITSRWAEVTAVSGAELLLKGYNAYAGGTITGDGEIGQWGDTTVVADTTIDTKYYDLDGKEGQPSTTTVHPSTTLTINSQRIDKPGDPFDGTVVNDGGTFAINTLGSWTIGASGVLDLRNNAGPAMVAGSPILVEGHITTRGGNEMLSPVTFRNSTNVVAAATGDILRLRHHTNYEGGSYTGAGGIIQDATAYVNAPTTIDLGFFDMDGTAESSLVELHADLTLNVDRVDMSDNRFNGIFEVTDPARLTVKTPTSWSMGGTMNVAGPPETVFTIAGAEVILDHDVFVDQKNTLRFEADVSGPGNFTGNGDVKFLANYSPGASPALVSADGDISFADSARLLTEIGGTTPGTDYDQLVVNGDVTLDGTAVFRFINGFSPRQGDVFDVIVAGGITFSLLGDEDIRVENLLPGFQYDAAFEPTGVFRLTALNDGVFVPEPSALALFILAALACVAYRLPGRSRIRGLT